MKRQEIASLLNLFALRPLARIICIFMFMGFFLSSVTAFAAVDMFLEIDGVVGSVKDPRHMGAMDVVAFSEIPGSKRHPFKIVVTKFVDKSSLTLRQMLNSKEVASNAILTIYTPGPKVGSFETVMIEMYDVSVNSANTLSSGDDDRLTETVSLNFGSAFWSYIPLGSDGSAGGKTSVGYNIKTNTKN
jgi:type VI secretion system secreted protein Hcp